MTDAKDLVEVSGNRGRDRVSSFCFHRHKLFRGIHFLLHFINALLLRFALPVRALFLRHVDTLLPSIAIVPLLSHSRWPTRTSLTLTISRPLPIPGRWTRMLLLSIVPSLLLRSPILLTRRIGVRRCQCSKCSGDVSNGVVLRGSRFGITGVLWTRCTRRGAGNWTLSLVASSSIGPVWASGTFLLWCSCT